MHIYIYIYIYRHTQIGQGKTLKKFIFGYIKQALFPHLFIDYIILVDKSYLAVRSLDLCYLLTDCMLYCK